MQVRPEKCDRAREYASRRLDGELGELEGYLLRAHLGRCVDCREYEATISEQTTWLRGQQLEPLSRPIEVPRRRVRATGLRNRAAVGAAFALALVGSLQAVDILKTHQTELVPELPAAGSSATLDREFRNVQRANLATRQLQPSMLRQVAASE
jgi:predicted anti-sigma-YlaC factor YlaD